MLLIHDIKVLYKALKILNKYFAKVITADHSHVPKLTKL